MNWDNIETRRLILKGLDDSDAEFLFGEFSDGYVCRYLYDAEPFTAIDEARQLIAQFASCKSTTINRWVITDKGTGRRLGTCGFHCWDKENNCIEIGYDLREEHCRKGIMTEALTAAIGKAFSEKGMNRIQAFVSVDNAASCALLGKLGFTNEGVIREKHLFRGRYYDHFCYSLLKREWLAGHVPGDGTSR